MFLPWHSAAPLHACSWLHPAPHLCPGSHALHLLRDVAPAVITPLSWTSTRSLYIGAFPQQRGKPTVFHHPILQLLARYRLPFKAKLLQILLRWSLLSPLPWSFCPSHSTVTGLLMAVINIHTSGSHRHSSVPILANISGILGIFDSCVL